MSSNLPPYVKNTPLMGLAMDVLRRPLEVFPEIVEKYGYVSRARYAPGMATSWIIGHPDGIEQIMKTNQKNYPRSAFFNRLVKEAIGLNLFTADGEIWHETRKKVAPTLHRQKVMLWTQQIIDTVNETKERWFQYAKNGETVFLHDEMALLALKISLRTMFSNDIFTESTKIREGIAMLLWYANYRISSPFSIDNIITTPRKRRYLNAKAIVYEAMTGIMEERKKGNIRKNDLLDLMLDARDEETGIGMSEDQIKSEILGLLTGSNESTSAMLTWTMYELSRNPDKLEKMREEISGLGKSPDSPEDFMRLQYPSMVIYESMRMYPPVWLLDRSATKEDVLMGYDVAPDTNMLLPFFVLYRHPDFWENPNEFVPERFMPEEVEKRHKYLYLPFGAGARNCIGNHLVMIESIIILAILFESFDIEMVSKEPIKPIVNFALVPGDKGAIRIKVRK
ncbi:MAG: cytochrome P450 [Bacteroidia bacterium]|nr:cytochrome P450 [Bacteroidia bacterium]